MNTLTPTQNPPTPAEIKKFAAIVGYSVPKDRLARVTALQGQWQMAFDKMNDLAANGETRLAQRQQADFEAALESGAELPFLQPRSVFFASVQATIEGCKASAQKYSTEAHPLALETLSEFAVMVKARVAKIEAAEKQSADDHGATFSPSPTLTIWTTLLAYLERFKSGEAGFSTGSSASPFYSFLGLL